MKKAKTQKKSPEKISKEMTLGEIARDYPETISVLFEYGMHCIGCPVSMMETLEQGAKAHGMSEEKINKMIEEMNKKIKKKK
ncbi:MAG: DUF1858 domain-containing protein [archaeon]|nr:DUF1858 domain-containing protein [Candidatus Micrarchaeota archaeon]